MAKKAEVPWIDTEAGQQRLTDEFNDRTDDLLDAWEAEHVVAEPPSNAPLIVLMIAVFVVSVIAITGTFSEVSVLRKRLSGVNERVGTLESDVRVLGQELPHNYTPVPVQAIPPPTTHNLVVRAKSPSWVRISSGFHTLYEGTVKKGWTKGFEEPVTVRVGVPGALEYELDGEKVVPENKAKHPENLELVEFLKP